MKIINTKIDSNIDLKICLIADIHFSKKYNVKLFDKITKKINDIKPNYICITGDIIDDSLVENEKNIFYLYNFIKDLGKISKVIISLGNHDIAYEHIKYRYPSKLVNNLKELPNVIFLDNEIYIDNKFRFIGYTQSLETTLEEVGYEKKVSDEVDNLVKVIDDKYYNILLSHNPLYLSNPDVYNNITNFNKIKLILSGHTHNSLLPTFIKTNTAFISPQKRFFVKNSIGHFKCKETHIIVTGGITKLSKASGIFSLFNFLFSPVIDCITIENKK